jgi:hypothetical protein
VLAYVSGCSLNEAEDPSKNWESLRSLYPGLITFGCISQGLNSILDYILANKKIMDVCLKGKQIVDGTKSSAEMKKRFQEIQKQLKLTPATALKFSSKNQWASLVKCVALLVSQKEAFQMLIGGESKSRIEIKLRLKRN